MNKRARLYDFAYNFLIQRAGEKALRKELKFYSHNSVSTLNAVYKRLLISMQNRGGYPNYLGSVDEMSGVLYDFDCKKVMESYENNQEKLFNQLQELFPAKHFDFNNKRSAWYQYSLGIISSARFLSQLDSYKEFDKFVNSFTVNEYTVAALPMVLSSEIHGYGYALACDFLKEIGYVDYGKPDTHLRYIIIGVGLLPESATDYEVAKEISKIARQAKEKAVVVDKVFWIIGSGELKQSKRQIGRQKKLFVAEFMKSEVV